MIRMEPRPEATGEVLGCKGHSLAPRRARIWFQVKTSLSPLTVLKSLSLCLRKYITVMISLCKAGFFFLLKGPILCKIHLVSAF